MAACPLYNRFLVDMDVSLVKIIEDHVSSDNCPKCLNPLLKDLLLPGPTWEGVRPLLLACGQAGDLDAVKHIIENWGVDVEATSIFFHYESRLKPKISGARPLFIAALHGHVEIVRYLLSKGANVSAKISTENNPEFDGLTPLEGALKSTTFFSTASNPDNRCAATITIIRLLLLAGADPRIPRQMFILWLERDWNPSMTNNFKLFKLLAGVPKLLKEDIRDHLSQSLALRQDNGNLLSAAFFEQDLETTLLLLHLGVNPDANGNWVRYWYMLEKKLGKTPWKLPLESDRNGLLHLLAGLEEDHVNSNLARMLVDYGAQPYRTNAFGQSPVDIWIETHCGEDGKESVVWNNRPDWIRNPVPTLKQLSAKTVHLQRISYASINLPREVISFLDKH